MANLNQLRVAILVDDGFEQVELTEPRKALDAAGAKTNKTTFHGHGSFKSEIVSEARFSERGRWF